MTKLLGLALLISTSLLAETPADIVSKAAQNMLRANRLRDNYTYNEKVVVREFDGDGQVKQTHETTKEVMVFAGQQIQRVIEKNGRPLDEKDARKEQEKVDRAADEASRLTLDELKFRLDKRDREFAKTNGWLTEMPAAFHFRLVGEKPLNGGQVFVVHGVPDPSYSGKNAHLLRCVAGNLYIDKQTYTLVKMDGEFLEDCSFGLFLAKVDQGSKVSFERVLVNSEVWLPKQITISGEGRALLKKFNEVTDIVYSGYRKFSTESRIVATSQPQ